MPALPEEPEVPDEPAAPVVPEVPDEPLVPFAPPTLVSTSFVAEL